MIKDTKNERKKDKTEKSARKKRKKKKKQREKYKIADAVVLFYSCLDFIHF